MLPFLLCRIGGIFTIMLVQDITHDLTQAMKAREEPRLSTLRMLKAELQKLQADKGRGVEITDDDVHGGRTLPNSTVQAGQKTGQKLSSRR